MAWAAGSGLSSVLSEELMGPGDFVRLAGQVVDVLHQVALVGPTEELRAAASQAVAQVRRGVVAAA
jgi:ATP-dependent RNA helicase HelY